MNYQQDKKLLEALQGKRVAIVGPSPHLMGKEIGALIDSYDLVCRVNEVHPTGYETDYGNRTDIVFHNCGSRFIDIFGERLLAKSIISKYLKYVICPCVKATGADNHWHTWPDTFQSEVVNNFQKINIFNIPFHWIGMQNYRYVYNLFGSEPITGQSAIIMLLEHEVEELFITGFSFYAQGELPKHVHRPGHTMPDLKSIPCGDSSHPQTPQKKTFVKNILKNYQECIIIDSTLNDILNCNHPNILELE